ncbi:hypothetical protein SISNIDRAFT_548421 [Sistotremastrum niveocremeum HHB9708]|uniref:MYND-type domain-containing protein n=1 Tax=Sistotremastrum niveocremeum HHB9708 TaxID=1314777 RepID=A0A164X0V5_9AGAM|nr:hypothetical protein SISNIDRAFT_548421 [Sistotremastrum niveocremeum HHB9708]
MRNCVVCETPTKKTCHGCPMTPYCSTSCQKKDWIVHIVTCNRPGREITTADRLAAMVLSGNTANKDATLCDYGFLNLSSRDGLVILSGIYREVFTVLDIKPKTLHRWRLEGTRYTNLLKAYGEAGTNIDPAHYAWLRQHPNLFDPPTKDSPAQVWDRDIHAKLWTHIVRMAKDPSGVEMMSEMDSWPPHKQLCWDFYVMIFGESKPTARYPEQWIKFGFCVDDKNDSVPWEGPIRSLYAELMQRCAFDEFCTAFNTSCLVDLMDKHGLKERRLAVPGAADFQRILSQSPYHIPCAWILKTLMHCPPGLQPALLRPFGFSNCRHGKDGVQLVRFYTTLFKLDVSISRVQHAAEQDRLYQLTNLPGFTPSAKEKRFLRHALRTENKAIYGSKLPPCYS